AGERHGARGHASHRDRPPRCRALDRGSRWDGSSRSMRFRTRLLISFGVVVMIPLLVFGLRIRREMSNRVTAEDTRRVDALFNVISADIARESDRIGARLAALKSSLVADDRFRSWVVRGENRGYVLDYAGDAMRLAGLDFLQIQDDDGRVVSSGHFRNEYDRLGPAVPGAGPALVRAATAESSFLALVTSDTLRIPPRRFRLIGGIAVDSQFLARRARDPEAAVGLVLPNYATEPDVAGLAHCQCGQPSCHGRRPAAPGAAVSCRRTPGDGRIEHQLPRDARRQLREALSAVGAKGHRREQRRAGDDWRFGDSAHQTCRWI